MKIVTVTICDPEGLHMRPSMVLVDLANLFSSELVIKSELNGNCINAKSIVQTTMMSATCGTKLQVLGNGSDEELAVEVISVFLQKKTDLTNFYENRELGQMIEQNSVQEILQYLKQYPDDESFTDEE